MFWTQLFRSLQPLHNPIGFGADDFVELELAALLVLLIVFHSLTAARFERLARRTGLCMVLLAALPVILRLALLSQSPIPTPGGADDFAHLLAGETLLHGRLANPAHPLHQFFETVFVLQEPAYSSIFPIGQGVALAIGQLLFGHPWAGVVLSVAAFCSLCYWMLRGWTSPGWALVGGLLAVIEFGPLRYWMNTYWGGAVSATAGCLVFGALPRLRSRAATRDAVWLGLGIGIQLLARPFECALLLMAVLLFFLPDLRRVPQWRVLAPHSFRGSTGRTAGHRIDACPEQASDRQLDNAPLHAQPVSIRSPYFIYVSTESGAARPADDRSTARLRRASCHSWPERGKPSALLWNDSPAVYGSIASSFCRHSIWPCRFSCYRFESLDFDG